MKHKTTTLVLAVGSLALGADGARGQRPWQDAEEALPADPRVTVGTLENGLRYYIRENERPENRAELRLVVNAGSVLEDDDQLGLAHFVEHMAFNGTSRFPKQELINYLERIGMRFGPDLNAYTSFDETVYMLQVPTDSASIVETAFAILEDWAHAQVFDPAMVDGERGVVVEEWRLGRGADSRMLDKQLPVLFQGSRYAERLPIGTKEVLENFEHVALTRFYRDWYRPDLMAVVAVGDFDKSWIEDLIREHFASVTPVAAPRPRTVFPVPNHQETLVAIATDKEATDARVSVYFKQPRRDVTTVGAYRRSLVERLYNEMLNQRLFELTQQPDPPFLYAQSGQGRLIRSKEVYVLGAGVAEGGIERGLDALLTEAERVARHGFTATELERSKTEILRRMQRAFAEREKTNSADYAFEYASAFLEGDAIPGVEVEYELHGAFVPGIQLAQVNGLAREWLSEENRVILVNAPEKAESPVPTEEALVAAFEAVKSRVIEPYEDVVSEAPLLIATPTPGDITDEVLFDEIGVATWQLSNGARVILKSTDFKDDEILFRASSPGGTSLADDADFIAAATAAEVVSRGGLGGFSLVELQKKLAGTAVSVNPNIGALYEGLGGSASPEDIETLFQLVYLTFTAPRRDSAAYLAFRSQINAFLANRSAAPEAAFADTLSVTLAQHHVRARPPTVELYEEMDLEKSMAFYQDRFRDVSDFTFVFVGNFDLDSMRPLVRTYLASLPSLNREEQWKDIGMRPPTGVIEKVVRRGMEPRSQTQLVFTGPFEYTRRNRHRLRSLTEVLQIKLRERLREELGGTYGVSVAGAPERDPEPSFTVTISFGSDPQRLEQLTAAVFEEIDSLKIRGALAEDVDKVKESQRRSRETSLKQNGYWLFQLLYADRLGTDPRDILTYEAVIDELTSEMIQEAARLYLPTDNYVRVSLYPEAREDEAPGIEPAASARSR